MKCTAACLTLLAGSALAAPSEFTQPGGDHQYHAVSKRFVPGTEASILNKPLQLAKRIGPVGIAVASVAASGVLGFVGGPVAARAMNSVFGVQKKRNVHVDITDLTFDEARELYIDTLVEFLIKENPYDGNDAAVCVGVGYKVSDPKATVDAAAFKFSADGQEHEYDCFILQGPASVEVSANATNADIAFTAPKGSTWVNGVLTLTE